MTKEKCSAVFHAVRWLALPVLSVLLDGCVTNQVKDFTPKSGMICDEVRITGKFHKSSRLDGVWFNGFPASAAFRHFPAPNGPLEILAVVPEGASNGPIHVRISLDEDVPLWVKGTDFKFSENFVVTGAPPAPVINSFSASPGTIKEGQTTTLSWVVTPATARLTLEGADVSGTTTKTVSPETTTFYELIAKNESCFPQRQTVLVTVIPAPKITGFGNPVYHPGDTLAIHGEGLAREGESSQVIFSQASTTVELAVSNPAAEQLTVPIPAAIMGGPVNVQVVVGSDISKTNTFTVDARKNGSFIDIKSKIGLAGQKVGSRQLEVSTNAPDGGPDLAVFRDGAAVLAQHNFQPGLIGGAALSPNGQQGISVTADPNGFSASYVNLIERFDSHYRFQCPVNIMDGTKVAAGRWHVLFSPDDTIVIVSSVPAGGLSKITIQVQDLVRRKNIGTVVQANCTACDLQGEVVNGNTVRIKVDGAVVATFPIY